MLIGFIGSPGSGKTTVAALAFSRLKDNGIVCEFIPEQARWYIAEKRNECKRLGVPFHLNDLDQASIMQKQQKIEDTLLESCEGNSIIVSDSSSINALLYMSEHVKKLIFNGFSYEEARKKFRQYDLLFLCSPLEVRFSDSDLNRVHDRAQSLEIARSINENLATYLPDVKPVVLDGTSEQRSQTVLTTIHRLSYGDY